MGRCGVKAEAVRRGGPDGTVGDQRVERVWEAKKGKRLEALEPWEIGDLDQIQRV
jgi:hypothetical protein